MKRKRESRSRRRWERRNNKWPKCPLVGEREGMTQPPQLGQVDRLGNVGSVGLKGRKAETWAEGCCIFVDYDLKWSCPCSP